MSRHWIDYLVLLKTLAFIPMKYIIHYIGTDKSVKPSLLFCDSVTGYSSITVEYLSIYVPDVHIEEDVSVRRNVVADFSSMVQLGLQCERVQFRSWS
jgi:hypothetical protein